MEFQLTEKNKMDIYLPVQNQIVESCGIKAEFSVDVSEKMIRKL